MNRWRHKSLFPSLINEFSALRDFLDLDFEESTPGESGSISLYESDDKIFVEAYLPGIDPEDIQISFEGGVLSIRGESKREEKDVKYHMKACQSFSYRVPIPSRVDQNAVPEAISKNGILKITFEKTQPTKPQKIKIKVEK